MREILAGTRLAALSPARTQYCTFLTLARTLSSRSTRHKCYLIQHTCSGASLLGRPFRILYEGALQRKPSQVFGHLDVYPPTHGTSATRLWQYCKGLNAWIAGFRMELLAHVSAPSSRKDDQRYSRQAESFLAFGAALRIPLHQQPLSSLNNRLGFERHDSSSQNLHGSGSSQASSPVMFLENTQLARSALESQLITSSLGPVLDFHDASARSSAEDEAALGSASPQINGDQSHEHTLSTQNLTSELSSPTSRLGKRRRNSTLGVHGDPGVSTALGSPFVPIHEDRGLAVGYVGDSRTAGLPTSIERLQSSQPQRQSHSASWEDDNVPSELPSSYSLSDVTSKSSKNQALRPPVPGSGIEAAPVVSLATSSQDKGTSQTAVNESASIHTCQVHLPAATTSPSRAKPLESTSEMSSSFKDLLIILTSPPPATSSQAFQTHVTQALELLANNTVLLDRYNPSFSLRQPRASERGYWRFDPSAWPVQLQIECWQFLRHMIGNGSAGWGIWATRLPGKAPAEKQSLGVVRVFCWGEVVSHVYLMLYVASKSKIKRTEATWIDADEEVVLRVV